MNKRYVITHEEYGIFLGEFIGLGIWSNLDPGGQTECPTFESKEICFEYISSWKSGNNKNEYKIKEVVPDDVIYASMKTCMKAGLEGWDENK